MLRYIVIYLSVILTFVSCNIKEDMSGCPGTILLDYTSYSDEILDEIKADEQVRIYIFDRVGVCERIYTFTYGQLQAIDFEFEVPMQYSNCYGVVWHGNDAADYICHSMAKGEHYDNFHLELNYDKRDGELDHMPAPLWASPLEPIEYCSSKSRHRIHMTRVHTRINVKLRQSSDEGTSVKLDMRRYVATIEAKNNCYHTDFSLERGDCCAIEYNNSDEMTDRKWARVGTLRLTPRMQCMLSVANVDTPYSKIDIGGADEINLVEYMLRSRGYSKSSVVDSEGMDDQRFLDLNKVWDVELNVKSGVVISLSINGWTVWFNSVDL